MKCNLLNSCNYKLFNSKTRVDSNKLSLNVEKTHIMLITNRNLTSVAPEIYWGNTLLDVVVECTFLGVKLDQNRKLENHIKNSSFIDKNEDVIQIIVDTTQICQCIQEFSHPEMNQRYRLLQIIHCLWTKIEPNRIYIDWLYRIKYL